MHSRIEIAVVAVAAAILSASAARAETDHRYIGLKACGKCHGKELMGDQVSAWEKGPHAGAYEALKSEKAIAIGKQRGLASPPVEAAECLKCHATGHGLTTAQLDKGKPLKLSDAVQCESCHGPGSGYRKNKDMSDREVAISKGMWEPGKNQQICLDCHNDESPTRL